MRAFKETQALSGAVSQKEKVTEEDESELVMQVKDVRFKLIQERRKMTELCAEKGISFDDIFALDEEAQYIPASQDSSEVESTETMEASVEMTEYSIKRR
jgi:hypothetical protein